MTKGERHGAQDVQEKEHGPERRKGAQRVQGQGGLAALAALVVVALFGAQLGAQVLTNVVVQWDANPTSDNVTSYTVTVDGNIITQPSTCTASTCQVPVNGLALGLHSVTVAAVNEWGVGTAPPVTFTINVPTQVKNVKAKKA